MKKTPYRFPFGQPVMKVEQEDRTPKKIFVLGVYSSAVHARWIGPDGKQLVGALAVASEPYIFWRGDGVEDILSKIKVPEGLGHLEPAAGNLNGPSGNALDELFLKPLGYRREDAWLCDLLPHSCMNPKQQAAIKRAYEPYVTAKRVKAADAPPVPKVLADDKRRREIVDELKESKAKKIVLLGDEPVAWFLAAFANHWQRLSDFGKDGASYGREHEVKIEGVDYRVIPLVHPRQAARLGQHSKSWAELHERWVAGRLG